jgi:hypothetical protein
MVLAISSRWPVRKRQPSDISDQTARALNGTASAASRGTAMAAISRADAMYVPASSTNAAPMRPASAATMAAAMG